MSYNGDMDMCITIRTLITHKGKSSVQAGAGIVFDSNPEKEYQECLNKAKALFQAFEKAGEP
jgi:anthranilate synthase component 1